MVANNSGKGQVSVELIITTSVMAALLLLMLMVNNSLQQSWGVQKQVLEATAAANQVAIAMNRAAAGGDGTTVSFMNTVSPDVTSIQIFDKRTVRAYYAEGGYASAALVTNDTNVSGSVPINTQVIVSNNGNTINLIAGPVAGPVGTACGGSGAACCANNGCNTGFVCSASTCTACGAQGQLCCAGSSCNSNLNCSGGSCVCGGSGQACCGGTTCSSTFACNSSTVICQACGASAGQLCCYNGSSAAYDNCSGGASISCNTSALPQPVCYAALVCSVPSVSSVVLNSSSGTNTTSENLSVSFSATVCSGSAYNVTDWRLNGASIALLNMPFNKNVSSATTGAVGDYSTYGNNGTLNGTIWVSNGEVGGAYNFSATNDRVQLSSPLITGTGDFTLAAWVYSTNSALVNYIMGNYGVGNSGGIEFMVYQSKLQMYIGGYVTSAASSISSSAWYHVAVTRSGGNITLYINGAQNGNGSLASSVTGSKNWAIGNGPDYTSERFQGIIDEALAFNRSLSAQQVNALYQAGLAGKSVNTLVSQELAAGNNWTAAVTTTDKSNDSATVLSNSVTIASSALSCANLSTANTVYTLSSSVSINGSTCFNVTAANVTLNCAGYSLTSNNSTATFGVYSNQLNTTVKNCNISNFSTSIFFNGAANGTISNANVSTSAPSAGAYPNGYGVLLNGASYNSISNINANAPSGRGISIFLGSNNQIANSIGNSSADYGIFASASNYNTITNSTGTSASGCGIALWAGSNYSTIANSTGTSNSVYGIYISASLNNNITNSTGTSNSSQGIRIDSSSSYNTISNSTGISNSNTGILLSSSNYNAISNSTGNSTSGYGIYILSGSNNTISNSTGTSASNVGTYLVLSSNNTLIQNKFISGASQTTVYVSSSSGNTFALNNFSTSTSGYYINDDTGGNFYNATVNGTNQGNIYPNVMNGSVSITGTVASSISGLYVGSSGAGYPYNNSTAGGKLSGAVVDNAPLTPTGGASLSACANLSTPNTVYNLTQSVSISGATCFNVTAQNVTLNCNGYSVTGNNASSTYGVYSNQFNTTIKNCNISNFQHGIYFNVATNGTISNTNASSTQTSGYGIWLYNSASYNTITSSTGNSTASYGIFLQSSSNYNTIINSTGAANTLHGIVLSSSYNKVINSTGSSNAYLGIYISSGSSNVVSNSIIKGLSNTFGALLIYNGAQNNTVANSTINGNAGAYAMTIQTGANTGNSIINNTLLNATNLLYLDSTSGANTFYWNNFTNTSGLYVNDSNGTNIYNTTISGHGEGNVWYNVINGSVNITGNLTSTGYPSLYYGSNGSAYPYNSTNAGGKLSGAVVDNAPLTPTLTSAGCTWSWTQRTSSGTHQWIGMAMSSDGTKIAAADYNNGYIWTSADSGATWVQQNNSGTRTWARVAMSSDGTKILAGAYSSAYTYYSNNSGVNWTAITMPSTSNWYGVAMSSTGSMLYADIYASGYIYNSSNNGTTWSQTGSSSLSWLGMACSADGTKVIAGTYSGGNICWSSNSGSSWSCNAPASVSWYSSTISSDGTKMAVSANNGYIYTSNDSGNTWAQRNVAGSAQWLGIGGSSDGTQLITAQYNTGYIYLSNNSGNNWASQATPGTGAWYSVAMSASGTKAAAGYWGSYIWTGSCQ